MTDAPAYDEAPKEPPAPYDPMVGGRIGPVRIEKRIGGTDEAPVYKGEHTLTNTEVSVRFLSVEASNDKASAAGFFREADLGQIIDHPNVQKVTETGNHEGRFFMLMESVRGIRLDELMQRDGRLSYDKASRLIRDIAIGLDAIHARGSVHRDLKPSSILLDHKDRPKISDLSHATVTVAGEQRGRVEEYPGTQEYAAPEQLAGGEVDARADIFSLGVIYYLMLTGKFPHSIVPGEPRDSRPIEKAFPSVDARAIPLVTKMLGKKPGDRYRSAKEVVEAFDKSLHGPKPIGQGTKFQAPADPGGIPVEVQRKLRGWSAGIVFGPGLVVLFLAGIWALGTGGFESCVPALKASSYSRMLAGAGVFALAGGCIILRRELRNSGRAIPFILLLLVAGGCAMLSTLALPGLKTSLKWEAIRIGFGSPFDLMVLGSALAGLSAIACFSLEEDSPKPVIPMVAIALGAFLWYWAATGGHFVAPFKEVPKALQVTLPVLVVVGLSLAFALAFVTGRKSGTKLRWTGVALLVVSAGAILLMGSTGVAGTLHAPKQWMIPFSTYAPTSSLSLAPVAFVLLMLAVLLLRNGLKRYYEFHAKK